MSNETVNDLNPLKHHVAQCDRLDTSNIHEK